MHASRPGGAGLSSPYATVLWDLDGTIADTVPLIRDSLRHAAVEVLGEAPPDDVLFANIFLSLEAQMRALDPGRVDELCAAYLEWNHAVSRERLVEHPGMVDVVRDIAARGIPQGLASSKSRAGIDLALELLGLEGVFGAVVTSDDVAAHKPDPEPLRRALELLGRGPEGACYVGDALTDVAAARAAGVEAIAVPWGSFTADELRAADPTHIATTVAELRAVLGIAR